MTKTFCDRCGAVVRNRPEYAMQCQLFPYYKITVSYAPHQKRPFDLCPKCMDAFKSWLKELNTDDES